MLSCREKFVLSAAVSSVPVLVTAAKSNTAIGLGIWWAEVSGRSLEIDKSDISIRQVDRMSDLLCMGKYYFSQFFKVGQSMHPRLGLLYLTDYEPGRNVKATVSYRF